MPQMLHTYDYYLLAAIALFGTLGAAASGIGWGIPASPSPSAPSAASARPSSTSSACCSR